MTTPAGWYDDGSGRQRWWDGIQWTGHFAPVAEQTSDSGVGTPAETGSVETSPAESNPAETAATETAAVMQSVAAVESSPSPTPEVLTQDAGVDADTEEKPTEPASLEPAEATETEPAALDAEPAEATETEASEPTAASAAPFTAPETPVAESPFDGGTPSHVAPAPAYPGGAPAYPGSAPAYPGSAAGHPGDSPASSAPGQPTYQEATPSYAPVGGGYPPAAPGYAPAAAYPGAYAAAPTGPVPTPVVGIVGLGVAALGTILSCIPATFVFGWIMLAAGFIVSLISLFLKGRKWPGIAGLVLSFVGTILGVVMAFVFVTSSIADAVRGLPTAPSSSDSGIDEGTGDDALGSPDAVEGTLGEPVTVTQVSGTSEVTVNSAVSASTDGSTIPSTNGGFVVIDITWTGIDGTSYVSPLYFGIQTAEGTEGTYDFFADGQMESAELTAGQTASGTVTFDVATSSSYTIIITDEMLQEVARISVTPTAG